MAIGDNYSAQNEILQAIFEPLEEALAQRAYLTGRLGIARLPICDSSAGIIRIRFAGRELQTLLSARQHRAPRAVFWQAINLLWLRIFSYLSIVDVGGVVKLARRLSH